MGPRSNLSLAKLTSLAAILASLNVVAAASKCRPTTLSTDKRVLKSSMAVKALVST
jgi:hypothetical protein